MLALALRAVVLQRSGTDGLGDGEHVGTADGAIAHECHVGQVERSIGEQHAGRVAAVLAMIEVFAGAKRGVEVALRAENLFGTEASVLVGAAGTGERARVDDHDLALRAKYCFRREISRHRCRGLSFRLGYGKLASFAVLVDLGRLDGRLRFACERPAHQRKVLRCGFAPLVTCGHAASFPEDNANIVYGSSLARWGTYPFRNDAPAAQSGEHEGEMHCRVARVALWVLAHSFLTSKPRGPLYSVIDRRMSWWECLYIVNGARLRWDVVVHRVEMSPVIAVVLAVLAFRFDLLGC